uniref:Glutathione peroxidase n=1 Tax=Rhodosorus marinus TaxID=101924 RepID=A0A7S0G792_9RHOD|mmetsp:Transcript_3175/g.4556  ORF Transcript_3175/g.4556 Transcript_3175/m.4556 type:complete len:208 (+) Transcript_3175:83-706(+)
MSAFVAASGFSAQGRSRLRFVSSGRPAVFGVSLRRGVQFQGARPYSRTTPKMAASLHDIKMKDIDGNPVDFSSMKGKPVLAVNVACFCGYTKKVYTMMKDLSEKYDDKIQVVAFPSNEFGAQEPGTPDEIKSFVSDQYGSKILIMEKSSVKGSSANEVFKLGKDAGVGEPQWNFDGRLIFDKDGKLSKRLTNAATMPDMDAEIQKVL